ncbi:MAG: hypothetical protein IH956_04740 [Chloroflexi bacterium]|nr:hypothetical protein [Chloroflexota bacterium]
MKTQIRLQLKAPTPFAEGAGFGEVGPYEMLYGRLHFAVDPEAPAYQAVVDLERAPRSPSGLVEYSTDVALLRPVDLSRGNRRLIYDVNNRGNKRVLVAMNDALGSNEPSSHEHAGNGFLMRRGYSIVWSGWQGDLLPGDGRLTMDLPVATDNGGVMTGVVRSEFVTVEQGVVTFPLSGSAPQTPGTALWTVNDYTRSYEVASLDAESATLTVREYERDPRVPVPSTEWQFATLDPKGRAVPSTSDCYVPAGLKPGWIYELIYTAKDPPVMGLGLVGVRDLVSYLLHGEADDDGAPNPLQQDGTGIERAYAWGVSQSGRFLRELVYRGFNEDTQGRRVFDGIAPHVAGGGRVTLNYRFAQPGRYPREHCDHLYPSDQFPFAYHVTTDPLTGKTDGILKRPDTDPLVVHTQSSSEYWERRGSLVHTDAHGNDLGGHPGARVYLFSSSQHGSDPLKGPQDGPYRHLSNPNKTGPLLRALVDALDAWATHGTAPPDSRVPSLADETAAPADTVSAGFPPVPGVSCPTRPSRVYVQDHGPDFDRGIISTEPPTEDMLSEYRLLVPQIDADGNETAGIRTPAVEVPLATYTGWNYRETPEKALAGLIGSFLPFAKTDSQRRAAGDSRPAIEERYRSRADYVRRVELAARRLVDQRLLLQEDADRYVDLAMREEAFD